MDRDFRLISADSHVNPPPLFWADYLPERFKDQAPKLLTTPDGDFISFQGQTERLNMLSSVAGTKAEDYKLDGDMKELLRQSRPSGWDPAERLKDLDMDNVYADVLYGGGPMFSPDPEFCLATFDAYNRWLSDFCSAAPERLIGLGYIPTWDVDLAVSRIEDAARLGLRGVVIPAFPHAVPSEGGGYSRLAGQADIKMAWRPSDKAYPSESFDPLWAKAIELGLPVHFHLCAMLYPAGISRKVSFTVSSTVTKLFMAEPITEMILEGLFVRFPELTVVTAESGIGWASFLLEYMDRNWLRHRHHDAAVSALKELPSYYFHQNIKATFISDPTAIREREVIGVDVLMWGSDFPHSDGTWPDSMQVMKEHAAILTDDEAKRVFCLNAAKLYGIDIKL